MMYPSPLGIHFDISIFIFVLWPCANKKEREKVTEEFTTVLEAIGKDPSRATRNPDEDEYRSMAPSPPRVRVAMMKGRLRAQTTCPRHSRSMRTPPCWRTRISNRRSTSAYAHRRHGLEEVTEFEARFLSPRFLESDHLEMVSLPLHDLSSTPTPPTAPSTPPNR
jgi:hypothetical protein